MLDHPRLKLAALATSMTLLAGLTVLALPAQARVTGEGNPVNTWTGRVPKAKRTPPTRGPDTTSATERRRVDAVKTPKLKWYACYDTAQCATVRLPLDYDHPKGPTTELALVRVPAKDRKHRIGSLFVNPGGPGGSATDLALSSPFVFSPSVTRRFDVVGIDPRGVANSDNVRCFRTAAQQNPVYDLLGSKPFPTSAREESRAVSAYQKLGRGCSTTGRPLSASMSTAEVARDMDVLRRAVGDQKLSYLGFSYGTYLGQVYANLFPDRVRAMVLDGVIDPVGWTGTATTRNTPMWDRIRSAEGSSKALREILRRCDKVGTSKCSFAPGNPLTTFETITQRLKKKPVRMVDELTGEPYTFGYADLIGLLLTSLYAPDGSDDIIGALTDLVVLTAPSSKADRSFAAEARSDRAALRLARTVTRVRSAATTTSPAGFPYDNSFESLLAVECTDAVNPSDAAKFPAYADAADRRVKHFGRLWTWNGAGCASKTWTARDEDAYRGPFSRRTAKPVLVVGSTWDPATSYQSAVAVAKLLPGSRLLSSDNWGHTAYGTSDCVTSKIDTYLLKGTLPKKGTRCHGDVQPFVARPSDRSDAGLRAQRRVVDLGSRAFG